MKISPWLVFPVSLLVLPSVFADIHKQILHNVDASNLISVELLIPVGELDIEIYNGNEIQLEIEIDARRRWFSFRNRSVDHIELEVRDGGPKLYLGIDEQNIEQHWRVRMPAKLALEIDMGVGDIQIEDFSNNLDVEVGVGSVRVDVVDTDFELIHLTAGVGDASIQGFSHRADNERNFISAESNYHGDGELQITIEAGVGDIIVRNNR